MTRTWKKTLVGLGVVAALAVPTGIAFAATNDGDHGPGGPHAGIEMMDNRGGNMNMGHGSMDHGSMDHGSMGGEAPAR